MKMVRDVMIGIFNVLYRILMMYSQWVLLVIVAIVSADVVARNFFNYSIKWAQEVSLLLIVWMTFLSMAIGVEKGVHIAIELFYSKFPKPFRAFLDKLNTLVLLFVGCFFAYYGAKLTMSTWSSTLASTKWPAGMLYLMIPVGGICITYFTLTDLLGWKKYKKTHQYEQPEGEILPDGGKAE